MLKYIYRFVFVVLAGMATGYLLAGNFDMRKGFDGTVTSNFTIKSDGVNNDFTIDSTSATFNDPVTFNSSATVTGQLYVGNRVLCPNAISSGSKNTIGSYGIYDSAGLWFVKTSLLQFDLGTAGTSKITTNGETILLSPGGTGGVTIATNTVVNNNITVPGSAVGTYSVVSSTDAPVNAITPSAWVLIKIGSTYHKMAVYQ